LIWRGFFSFLIWYGGGGRGRVFLLRWRVCLMKMLAGVNFSHYIFILSFVML